MSARLFQSLLYKATQIQREIEREHQRRWPDSLRLLKLKKIRLVIKDRLQRMVGVHAAALRGAKLELSPIRVRNH